MFAAMPTSSRSQSLAPQLDGQQARTCFSEKYLTDFLQETNSNGHEKVKIQRSNCSHYELFVFISLCFLMVWNRNQSVSAN